ncbi:MAG: hypothetical protein JW818_12220, partial [Pirellulales bacterium]|nr:hypothetical protein [Pirellulales bacterium]
MTGVISHHQVIGCLFAIVALIGSGLAVAEDSTPKKVETVARVNNERLLKSVEPLGPASFKNAHGDARTRGTLQKYYDSVLDWGRVLQHHFQSVPGHPDWGYYGDGDNKENSIRAVCYAVCTNAFLAEIEPPTARLKPAEQDRFRDEAVAALRYVAQAHRANGGACLHGKPWGKQWQSAMWARSLATGAWLLWDKLDRPTQLEVTRLVEFEADRFLTQPPRSQLRDNTGAEENAWNAGLISLACC